MVYLRLPSGEQVAAAFRITPMTPRELWLGTGSRLLDPAKLGETKAGHDLVIEKRKKVFDACVDKGGDQKGAMPLWYYILREAEYYGVGRVAENPSDGEWGGQFPTTLADPKRPKRSLSNAGDQGQLDR
ncbi:MAG: hypothetical protein JWP35_4626 [Caulobacter sp.]|nr:hypothetical protein [Caulobacter sp.]